MIDNQQREALEQRIQQHQAWLESSTPEASAIVMHRCFKPATSNGGQIGWILLWTLNLRMICMNVSGIIDLPRKAA